MVSELEKTSSLGLESRMDLKHCGLCFYNFLTKTNNSGLGIVLLLCLISNPQTASSSGIKPKSVCQGCEVCFCNLLSETSNFAIGTCLLSCLFSELQESSSSAFILRTIFQSFYPSSVSVCCHGVSMPSCK
jgi:hypothetical protein